MNLTILCCVGCVLYVAGHHIRDPSGESISFVWLYGWRHNRYIGRFRIYIVGCHAGQRAVSTICKSYRYVAIRLDGVGAHGDDLVQLIVLGGVFARADRSGSRGQLGSPQLLAGLGGVPDLRSHTGNRDLFPGQGVLHVVSHGHLVLPAGILAEGAARAGVEDHTHKAIRGLMAVVRIILVFRMEGLIRVLGRYLNDLPGVHIGRSQRLVRSEPPVFREPCPAAEPVVCRGLQIVGHILEVRRGHIRALLHVILGGSGAVLPAAGARVKGHRHVAVGHGAGIVGIHGDDLVQLIVLGGVFARADRSGSRGQLGSPQLLAGLGGVPDLRSHTGNRDLFPGQGVLHVVSHGHLVLPAGILAEGAARAGVEDHTHKAIRGLMAVVRIILVFRMEGLIRVLGRYLNDLRQRAINGIYCPCLINRRRRHKFIDRRSGIHLFPVRHIGQIGGGSKALHLLFCRQALC